MQQFTCKGHPNLLAAHGATLEFTMDSHLTRSGDCIVGVRASNVILARRGKIRVMVEVNGTVWEFEGEGNPSFSHHSEMVFRRSDYIDSRTFATRCTAVAANMPEIMRRAMKDPNTVMHVVIYEVKNVF